MGPNGGTIFLPAAGSYRGGSLKFVGERGVYFSSTHDANEYAYSLQFSNIFLDIGRGNYLFRRYSARQVKSGEAERTAETSD